MGGRHPYLAALAAGVALSVGLGGCVRWLSPSSADSTPVEDRRTNHTADQSAERPDDLSSSRADRALLDGAGTSVTTLGPFLIDSTWTDFHHGQIWDLTTCDLQLTFLLDLSGLVQTNPAATPHLEVGLREEGASDFDPGLVNQHPGGIGGWMVTRIADLGPEAGPEPLLDLDDKHYLCTSAGRDEKDYDVLPPYTITTPFGTYLSHGLWFDRDGVDPRQAQSPLRIKGANYDTLGVYTIEIVYHAVTGALGTMFATVNGIPSAFWSGVWLPTGPDIPRAGLSYAGTMSKMQLFIGARWTTGVQGSARIDWLKLSGCTAR